MIIITDTAGMRHYLHPDAIARVTHAGPNGHRIGAYVKTFDGKTIEAMGSAEEIASAISAARMPEAAAKIESSERRLLELAAFIASDAMAISYQSLGQYRTALLEILREEQAAMNLEKK